MIAIRKTSSYHFGCHFIPYQAPFFSYLQECCEDVHRFCPDFHRFFPDFHKIKTFGGSLAPCLLHHCDQVHFKHERPHILSPDSHVTIGTIHQTQDAASVLWVYRHNSRHAARRPWRYCYESWMNKTKFHKQIRQKIFTKIYRNYHILAITSMRTTVCWEAPLDLETLGLSLQCLLGNPALCMAKLICVCN